MTNQFHKPEDHGRAFALLFDSYKIEAKFKERAKDFPYSIIKDKEEKRISSMLNSAGEIGAEFISLQTSAVCAVAIARSADEAFLMHAGAIRIIPNGIAICPTCLAKAILTCEENLTVLKDIQEATKQYAIKL